jgi:hypothetical protein
MTTTQAAIARPSALSNAPAGIFAVLGVIAEISGGGSRGGAVTRRPERRSRR